MAKTRTRAILMGAMTLVLCVMLLAAGTYALFTDTAKVQNHLCAGNLNLRLDRLGLKVKELTAEGYLEESAYGSYKPEATEYSEKKVAHHYAASDNEDVFMTYGNTLFAPGAYREVEMKISHEAHNADEISNAAGYAAKYGQNSSVAFLYWLELRLDADKNADVNWKELAKQITLSVCTSDDEGKTWSEEKQLTAHTIKKAVTDKTGAQLHFYEVDGQVCLFAGDAEHPMGVIGVGENQRFRARVAFDNKGYTYNPDTGVLSSANDAAQNGEFWFDLVVHAVQQVDEPVAN